MTTTMNAMTREDYGGAEVLTLRQISRPTLGEADVLVEVIATALHKGDWHLLTGTPYLIRAAGFGLFKPKQVVPGMAVAGRVAAVGPKVTTLKVGDEVFGELGSGGFAEYVRAGEKELVHKPAGLSFEEAASIPISATTALQGLRDAGKLQAGESVLIVGASGGVGSFAVQLARAMGAEVTGVCSGRNVEWVSSLGAHHVIDYQTEDFTKASARYDLVLDLVGNPGLSALRVVLSPKGRVVAGSGGADHPWVGPLVNLIIGMATNLWASRPFIPLMATPTAESQGTVARMMAAGELRAPITERRPLGELAPAMTALGTGHSRGKTVITIATSPAGAASTEGP